MFHKDFIADGTEARGTCQGRHGCAFADRTEARGTCQGRHGCAFADGTEAALGHPWPPRHSRLLRISGAAAQGCTVCGFADGTEARGTCQGRHGCAFADRTEARAARQGRRACGFDQLLGRAGSVNEIAELLAMHPRNVEDDLAHPPESLRHTEYRAISEPHIGIEAGP